VAVPLGFLGCSCVTVRAASARNRRERTIPLRHETAREVSTILRGRIPLASALPLPRSFRDKAGRWLRFDLAAAEVYLGSAEQIAAALGKGTTALQVVPGAPVFEFGAVAALYDLAERLVLAAMNRAVAPTSKAGIAKWYERTPLTRGMKRTSSATSCGMPPTRRAAIGRRPRACSA